MLRIGFRLVILLRTRRLLFDRRRLLLPNSLLDVRRSLLTGGDKTKSLIDNFSLLLELEEPLAQIEVPEVAPSDGVQVLLCRVSKVDALVVVELGLSIDI